MLMELIISLGHSCRLSLDSSFLGIFFLSLLVGRIFLMAVRVSSGVHLN
jgi:hypothetical protein